jgi:hypothetical protein
MLETVRTSYTILRLAEGINNSSCERERERLDEVPLMLDEDPPVMGRERGHNVLPFQLSADEIGSAVELDRAVNIDLADERHSALGDGKSQATVGIRVGFEREAVREMAENRPSLIAEDSGEPGSMIGEVEASAGLLEVVVAKKEGTCPPQRPKIGTEVEKDTLWQRPLKLSTAALRPGSPGGIKRRWIPNRRWSRMTWERL